jgi:diacylglycerol kinase family enzyme
MQPNPFFVVNPHSANGRTLRQWEELRAELRRALGEVHFELTRGAMHAAAEQAHRILSDLGAAYDAAQVAAFRTEVAP